jgi:hypothetical protein
VTDGGPRFTRKVRKGNSHGSVVVTIPKETAEMAGIEPGDTVTFAILEHHDGDGGSERSDAGAGGDGDAE